MEVLNNELQKRYARMSRLDCRLMFPRSVWGEAGSFGPTARGPCVRSEQVTATPCWSGLLP
jgi:hypothetical protein